MAHKIEHSRQSQMAELSGLAGRNHGDMSEGAAGHFYFFSIVVSCLAMAQFTRNVQRVSCRRTSYDSSARLPMPSIFPPDRNAESEDPRGSHRTAPSTNRLAAVIGL